jgi:hypothetical protein
MDFERARSDEQKMIRLKQITDSARKLFAEEKFEKITLASIAKELSFTRANLYKYISSKEEIFLHIITEDIWKWTMDLSKAFSGDRKFTIEEISEKWALVYYENRDMIKAMSLLYTIIEKNVSVEKLAKFKHCFFVEMEKIVEITAEIMPDMTRENIIKFLQFQFNYVIGFYPSTLENEVQSKAIELSGVQYEKPDFVESLKELLIILIKGLS